jgi:hypothetical protein
LYSVAAATPLNREDKKSGVLSPRMSVHEADIDNIQTKLLKDKSVTCGTLVAIWPFVAYLSRIPADREIPPSGLNKAALL